MLGDTLTTKLGFFEATCEGNAVLGSSLESTDGFQVGYFVGN